jgi:hypothetical protein
MQINTGSIYLSNFAGDDIRFHQTNQRNTKCAECGAKLASGRGVRRYVKNSMNATTGAKSGFICESCAGAAILDWAKMAPDADGKGFYSYSDLHAQLLPFDGACAVYKIPAQELAQAWHDHGSFGLRYTAEQLKAQARESFLSKRGIPITNEKINLMVAA